MRNLVHLFLPLLLLPLVGCFSVLQPAPPDQTRFYVLTPPATGAPAKNSIDLAVRRVELPGYLDSSKLVVRLSEYEVSYWPSHRWGESLEGMIGRSVAAELERLYPGSQISTGGGRGIPHFLELNVLRFDGTPEERVEVSFEWTLHESAAREPVARGRIVKTGEWGDAEASTLVATLADLLEAASQELAENLPWEP